MPAQVLKRYRRRHAPGGQAEARPPARQLDILGAHVRVPCAPVQQHPRRGAGRHRGDELVVGVQDCQAAGAGRRKGLDQLAFRLRDGGPRSELADVGGPDVEDEANRWGNEAGQGTGGAPTCRAPILQHQVPGRLIGPQHGQREPYLGVE